MSQLKVPAGNCGTGRNLAVGTERLIILKLQFLKQAEITTSGEASANRMQPKTTGTQLLIAKYEPERDRPTLHKLNLLQIH